MHDKSRRLVQAGAENRFLMRVRIHLIESLRSEIVLSSRCALSCAQNTAVSINKRQQWYAQSSLHTRDMINVRGSLIILHFIWLYFIVRFDKSDCRVDYSMSSTDEYTARNFHTIASIDCHLSGEYRRSELTVVA